MNDSPCAYARFGTWPVIVLDAVLHLSNSSFLRISYFYQRQIRVCRAFAVPLTVDSFSGRS